jgi:hypothetical protein
MWREYSFLLFGIIVGFIIMNFMLKWGTKYQIKILIKQIYKFLNNLREQENGKKKK